MDHPAHTVERGVKGVTHVIAGAAHGVARPLGTVAKDVARPIVKTAKVRSSWECNDTAWECYSEVGIYLGMLLAAIAVAWWAWHRFCKQRVVNRQAGFRTLADVSPRKTRQQGLEAVVEMSEMEEGSVGTPAHRRNISHGSELSLTSLDEEALSAADKVKQPLTRRKPAHRRTGSLDSTLSVDSNGDEKRYTDPASDVYAPKLPQVSQWVKDVLSELSEVTTETPTGSHHSATVDFGGTPPAGLQPADDGAVAPAALSPRPAPSGEVPELAGQAVPRTAMHSVSRCWLETLSASEDGTDGGSDQLAVGPLLEAFAISNRDVGERLGAIMAPAVKNDAKNLEVVRKAWETKYGKAASLRELLKAEIDTGMHKPGASGLILRDPSVAVAMVWLRRALAFQTAILQGVVTDTASTMSAIVGEAYKNELEKHHNWVLKNTMKVALSAVPKKDEFLDKLRGSDGELHVLREDLAELVAAQKRVLRAIAKPLVDLDLDRSCRNLDLDLDLDRSAGS